MRESAARAVVLISGSGTNLQALIDAANTANFPMQIAAVISDKPDAYGLERAQKANIAAIALPASEFSTREDFDHALAEKIAAYSPDLIILAGFMRILGPAIVNQFAGKILNIHPALLPLYKGLHTHKRALAARDVVHGTTVHFVTNELDDGPAVVQAQLCIDSEDTVDSLSARVQELEYIIYPMAARWFCEGRLEMHEGEAYLDDISLTAPIIVTKDELNP